MNATGLPIPTSGAAPAPAATPPAAPAVAPADFLLMLGQLLGGATSQNAAGAAKATSTAAPGSESEPAESDGADALAILSIVPMMPWSNPQNQPAAAAAAADVIGSLGLMSLPAGAGGATGSAGNDALLLASLADTLKSDDTGASIQSNLSAQQSLEAAQSLRAATAGDAASTRALHHPVGSSAWADELGTRLTLMADRGQHSASLRLSPEHLGPLEVRIAIRDDQASVWFGAAHADTRAAIEQALPRLRELFASQGISLADAGVFQDAPKEQPRLSPDAFSPEQSAAMEADAIAQVGPIRLGLVDAYA